MQENIAGLAGEGQYPLVEWGADVDWLTWVYDRPEQGERARFRAEQWQETALHSGDKRKAWSLGGFSGSLVGNVAIGTRARETVVQCTSAAAGTHYGALSAIGGRPSRLDLAVTGVTEPQSIDPVTEAYRPTRPQLGRGRRTDSRTLIVNTAGGATCYVGAPSSEQRLRIYDKGAEDESSAPGIKWRWEVQCRRARAVGAAAILAVIPLRHRAVAGMVVGHCQRVGLVPPGVATAAHTFCGPARTNDSERTMMWLDSSVRPAIARCWPHYGLRAILDALGISRASLAELLDQPDDTGE